MKKANAGEVIQVTDRGRVVAQLRAPGPVAEEYPHPLLLKAAAEGKVKLAQHPPPPDLYAPRPVSASEGAARKILDELRGER